MRARPALAQGSDAIALLRLQVHHVHQLLDENVVAAMQWARARPAVSPEILSLYAHALCTEDIATNLLLRAAPPLFTRIWTGGQLVPWDLTSLQGYAEVVHAATDAMLVGLHPAELRMPVDLSEAGLGCTDATWVLNRFILWQAAMTCGEIASIERPQRRRLAFRDGRQEAIATPGDRGDEARLTPVVLQPRP
jgi:hypothetical protein